MKVVERRHRERGGNESWEVLGRRRRMRKSDKVWRERDSERERERVRHGREGGLFNLVFRPPLSRRYWIEKRIMRVICLY